MEFWYMATGPKHWLDLHKTHMQGVTMFIPGIAPNGQIFQQEMKVGFEPVELYRCIFPKEGLPLFLNSFTDRYRDKFGIKMMTAALRKAIGLDELPANLLPPGGTSAKLPVSFDYIRTVPIGIKTEEDRIMATGVKQEPI